MAKNYIDAAVTESKDEFTVTGSATVTGAVRVAWDDSTPKNDLIALLERVTDRIREEIASV